MVRARPQPPGTDKQLRKSNLTLPGDGACWASALVSGLREVDLGTRAALWSHDVARPPCSTTSATPSKLTSTMVFAALAVARYRQHAAGVTLKKLVQSLRPLRSVVIAISDQTIPPSPTPGPDARAILDH